MIKKLIVMSFVFSILTFSQVTYEKVLEKILNEISIPSRVTNCGVYYLSSFDISNDSILLNSFDPHPSELFVNNKAIKTIEKDITVVDNLFSVSDEIIPNDYNPIEQNLVFKKSFEKNIQDVFIDDGGILTNKSGEKIKVLVENRNILSLEFNLSSWKENIMLDFPGDLACADFIGIDAQGNIFILIEKFITDIPLVIKREVYVLSEEGNILSILEIPSIKYCMTIRDFQIDADGNLFHLLCEKDKTTIFKWRGLTTNNKGDKFQYPSEYNYSFHYNEILPTDEYEIEMPKNVNKITSVSRTQSLRIAEKFVYLKYYCNSNNLAPTTVRAPDGDSVRTPSWLVIGYNATVPYKWGGYSTNEEFLAGLSSGKYAGDIHTDNVSSYAVGLDCSGLVSRAWVLPYKHSTSMMPSITTQYSSWDDLKPGDAIHKVGHVRLFVKKNPNGSLKIVEAASRNWNCSYWSFTISSLTGYTPRYYNEMETNYSFKQPTLIGAIGQSSNQVNLTWTCDTSNVKGYRIYNSAIGETWTLFADENTITDTSVTFTKTNQTEYYRVSSILNDGLNTESDWSNALGSGESTDTNLVLIVDGYERNIISASWQGPGHNFAVRYGQAIKNKSFDFDCIQNSLVENSQINLNDYEAIFWILGDESTTDETFNSAEQTAVKNYLENGGKLFVSGSEIGWDLDYSGSTSDKSFYNNYLKADYISDDANTNSVYGTSGDIFDGMSFYIGQTYEEDYPDEIASYGGSNLCVKYGNDKGAGILYSGTFGSSSNTGKIIHFGFPLETTANDTAFNKVISESINFFFDIPSEISLSLKVFLEGAYRLEQNFPNPFNPTTKIRYSIPSNIKGQTSNVVMKIYDILGQEIRTLVNEKQLPGAYEVEFDASNLSSGIYFYQLRVGNFIQTKKMLLLK